MAIYVESADVEAIVRVREDVADVVVSESMTQV